jgi:uncharacterized membrane protein
MTERHLRLTLAVGAAVAAAIAAYLTVVRYRGGALVCATGGCETVQRSSYAELLGVPVAVLGLAAYVVLLVSALTRRAAAIAAAAGLALAAVAFAAYLIYVQLAVLDAICVWCVAAEGLTVVIALAASARLLRVVE